MKTKNNDSRILTAYLNNELNQIFCEKCLNTFLTNIYDLSSTHVLLEKFSLGLEYFLDAIQSHSVSKTPEVRFIGIVDDFTGKPITPNRIKLFDHKEPDYRLIYIMEKLEHLNTSDELFFTNTVHNINWNNQDECNQIYQTIESNYGTTLTDDIRKLSHYYQKNKAYIDWDLHGDNLMRRPSTGEIVILDPYTINYHKDYSIEGNTDISSNLIPA